MGALRQLIEEFQEITHTMWSLGWDEKNGGNISAILTEEEMAEIDPLPTVRVYDLANVPENLIGKYLLFTASGSEFRTVYRRVETDLGIVRITPTGYEIVSGFEEGNRPTSELYMHLLAHSARLKVDANHRVVLHNHATEVSALSFVLEQRDEVFTKTLWRMITECLVVFPDGIGVLPWMICGNEAIGLATAEKLAQCRIVVWAYHGILATGSSVADCFGLIETVNKAAKLYLQVAPLPHTAGISDEELKALADFFHVVPRSEFLS